VVACVHSGPVGKEQLSRRTLLGMTSTAVAAGVALRAAPGLAATSDQEPPVLASGFAVDIQGCQVSPRYCVSIDVDPVSSEPNGKPPRGANAPAGPLVPGQARLRFLTPVSGGNADLAAWVRAVAKGVADRRAISITLFTQDRSTTARTYTLVDCFPISFDSGDFSTGGDANVAELVVQPTRVELA